MTASGQGQEATITRVFDAPRDRVWTYFTEPELFAQRFGTPPDTTPPSTVSRDVWPGGAWSATMVHDTDVSELPFRGTFEEVEVLTATPADAGEGKTGVTYRLVGHMPEEQYRQVEEGVRGFYDRLAERLARAG